MITASALRAKLDAFTGGAGLGAVPEIRREILLATFALNVLGLALPVVLLQIYDRIIPHAATETLTLLVIGLCVALVFEGVLRLARASLAGWAGARFEHQTGCLLAGRLLNARLPELERVSAGTHLDRFNAIEPVRDFYSNQAALLLIDLPFVALYLLLLAAISGTLALAPLIMLIVFLAIAGSLGRKLRASLEDRTNWDDRRRSFLIELLSGIHTIKGLAMEPLMLRRFEKLQDSSLIATYDVTYLGSLAQAFGNSFSSLSTIAIASIGSLCVIDGSLSVGGLAASILLAGRVTQPLLRAVGVYTQFQQTRVSQARIKEVLSYPLEREGRGQRRDQISGSIRLENATFAYASDGADLLKDVNLDIQAGEIVGIVGGTGSGKSTLLWMLFGGMEPTQGRLLFDDIDVRDFDINALRRQIGFIPQHATLFHGTVLENLTLFRGGLTIDYAQFMAGKLDLDRYFSNMPAGFETIVADGVSATLPAGIIQRIAIARALVDAPRLILFDDANSALDAEGDRRLIEILTEMRGGATIVLATHRPSLLALADRVFTLGQGQLRERENPGGGPS